MIRRLRGEVVERTASAIVVDVGGVGYLVHVSRRSSYTLGSQVEVHVHTHVREDALQLFGFADDLEREVFDLLLSVPSVGPVKAIGMLETPPTDIVELVRARDVARLSKLPGIGKKTAERMVVDLFDKFKALPLAAPVTDSKRPLPAGDETVLGDLTSALVNLGYKPSAAEQAAAKSVEHLGSTAELAALLKQALLDLGRR
jgi:Holliday junction DNA helicase RuvA